MCQGKRRHNMWRYLLFGCVGLGNEGSFIPSPAPISLEMDERSRLFNDILKLSFSLSPALERIL